MAITSILNFAKSWNDEQYFEINQSKGYTIFVVSYIEF